MTLMNAAQATPTLARHSRNPYPAKSLDTPQWIGGLNEIVERYDTYLIDQWGVIHNGKHPYPQVLRTLEMLKRMGKTVIILSNSGRRSSVNAQRLESLGIPQSSYTHLVTSGEVAWQMIRQSDGALAEFDGQTCYFLSGEDGEDFLEGLNIATTDRLDQASFILLTGLPQDPDQSRLKHLVESSARTGKPMICANPDHFRITQTGLAPSAGMLAQQYEDAGGTVIRIGKPHREIYQYALALAGASRPGRALAIGDSLHHDIAAGHASGLDGLLVLGGILADEMRHFGTSHQKTEALMTLVTEETEAPEWVAEELSWA